MTLAEKILCAAPYAFGLVAVLMLVVPMIVHGRPYR
jgi:hypothetical protein